MNKIFKTSKNIISFHTTNHNHMMNSSLISFRITFFAITVNSVTRESNEFFSILYDLILVFYSPLSCFYIIFICFYTPECLLAYNSCIPVNITFEGCPFPLHCEAITTKVFLSLFTCRMTSRLFLVTLFILSGSLTCYGFRICAFNVQSFGDSKSANAIIMNSVSRVWGWIVQCVYFLKKKNV